MTIINPAVFTFFNKLEKNNNRDWFEDHKPEFKALEKEIKGFSTALESTLNSDDRIEKTKMFRIYSFQTSIVITEMMHCYDSTIWHTILKF